MTSKKGGFPKQLPNKLIAMLQTVSQSPSRDLKMGKYQTHNASSDYLPK